MNVKISTVSGFNDQRAKRFFDVYPNMSGQVTVSIVQPNQFSGWHCHKLQYDIFFVASGELKIGIISPEGEITEVFLNSEKPETVFIPAGYWHSYMSGENQVTLIYYLSQKHNEDDEFRATEEEIFKKFKYKI
ncbi:WxcM-like domain-containing protein [Alphaproteobacteria bacterium]|nr:WxcM-like domain-containing protein [Alphaproteobacteria bacterium]MDB2575087.1 WxcM-like domain-containing protein [Alphaproteobacteria bacterium]MDB2656013.1 WxcM-like domain-containing protein [Alphaproteobacteria bacterium]